MARRNPPRKVTYFEPVPPRLARNTIIESTFEVGRRFRCTMRVDCGRLDPGAVIRPVPSEWHPRIPERLDEEELAGLARRSQCGLSARRTDRRRAPRGGRRIREGDRRAISRRPVESRIGFRPSGEPARSFRPARGRRRQPGTPSFRIPPGCEAARLSRQRCQARSLAPMSQAGRAFADESAPAARSAARVVCAPSPTA